MTHDHKDKPELCFYLPSQTAVDKTQELINQNNSLFNQQVKNK